MILLAIALATILPALAITAICYGLDHPDETFDDRAVGLGEFSPIHTETTNR